MFRDRKHDRMDAARARARATQEAQQKLSIKR